MTTTADAIHLPSHMQVAELTEPGGPDRIVAATRAVPAPGPGEVLVQVAYVGVNGPDLMQRKGLYPPPPGASDLMGLEIAGRVVATGDGVTHWTAGDSVCALTNGGGYAEYCTVDATHCLPIPDGLDLRTAATIPEAYFTVWSNVFMGAHLAAGETLLVHGGAGGIGTAAVALGKAFGARVVATDSPLERCRICTELGADRVIDYRTEDFVDVVRKEFGGADVIIDIVGGPYVQRNIKAARHDARIIALAFALGSKVEVNLMPVMLKRLVYTGSTLRSRPAAYKAEVARELREKVWPLFASGRLSGVIGDEFPLAGAGDAHRRMESAEHCGKIVLKVGGERV